MHTPGAEEEQALTNFDFDAVVIGSGFGGSVMTCRLSRQREIYVLESRSIILENPILLRCSY